MFDLKEATKSLIAVLVVLGAIATLFFPVAETAAQVLRSLGSVVIGYYFGGGTLTFGRKPV